MQPTTVSASLDPLGSRTRLSVCKSVFSPRRVRVIPSVPLLHCLGLFLPQSWPCPARSAGKGLRSVLLSVGRVWRQGRPLNPRPEPQPQPPHPAKRPSKANFLFSARSRRCRLPGTLGLLIPLKEPACGDSASLGMKGVGRGVGWWLGEGVDTIQERM